MGQLLAYLAYSIDQNLRKNSSSGGAVKSILRYLVENKIVDDVIIARTGDNNKFCPKFIVTHQIDEILSPLTNSVYYPVDPFPIIKRGLDNNKRYAITLLPCQVKYLRRLQQRGIAGAGNIVFIIELLCNYTPKPEWTNRLIHNPTKVIYRTNGWGGEFCASSNTDIVCKDFCKIWSNDVISNGLDKCKYCNIGCSRADITVGDPWLISKENIGDGKTLVFCHTEMGRSILLNTPHICVEQQPNTVSLQHMANIVTIKSIRPRSLLVWYYDKLTNKLNFGEQFIHLILAKFGYSVRSFIREVNFDKNEPCMLIIGSEFHHKVVDEILTKCNTLYVWGQGNGRIANYAKPVDMTNDGARDRIKICALRGPLTKAKSNFNENVPLLDPGFLLPTLLPEISKGITSIQEILYVPHEHNFAVAKSKSPHCVLDVVVDQKDIVDFMRRVASAKFVLTNSLHCLIFCLAYKIPCAVSLLDGETLNMPDKWNDVVLSIGGTASDFAVVNNLADGEKWWANTGERLAHGITSQNVNDMIDSFPFIIY